MKEFYGSVPKKSSVGRRGNKKKKKNNHSTLQGEAKVNADWE
jgi:hypothetical protein